MLPRDKTVTEHGNPGPDDRNHVRPREIDDGASPDIQTANGLFWAWLQPRRGQKLPSVPASDHHRLIWGWVRLVLGLTQIALTGTAIILLVHGGFTWRAVTALGIAFIATIASRILYKGRYDPRFQVFVKD